jgi:carbon storage regulator
MLKVSRKKGESIIIGENIKVTIHQNKKEDVIVGIDAPDDMRVLKSEEYLSNLASVPDRDAIWRKVLGEGPIELQ